MFRLIRYLKNYKKESIIGPLFKMLEACFELFVPLVMADIIDIGIVNEDSAYILKKGLVLVFLGVLGLACSLTAQYFAAKAALGFGTALRNDMYAHIGSFSYAELDETGTSTLITRMTNDINQAQTGVNLILRLFLRSPFIVAGAIVMSFTIDVKMAFIFLAASPVLAFVIYIIMTKNLPFYKKIQTILDRVTLKTKENLSGVRVIRAFSRQSSEKDEFDATAATLLECQLRAGKISALMSPATYVCVNAAIGFIMWFGGVRVNMGTLTQGEVIALINYMTQILTALLALSNLIVAATKAWAAASRINEVFATESSMKEGVLDSFSESEHIIEFKNVSFCYGKAEKEALENISFSMKAGETLGIIGTTGSGKTTLVNLIPRFYDVSGGEVLVKGVNVKEYTYKTLRGMIGLVPQKSVLFKGTIRGNMQWRKKDASDEEIMEALETAQAKEFVLGKEGVLSAEVSQGGKNFSGGQRQRLTIARALVGKPELLILDDSASALDYMTDAKLRKALSEQKAAVIIISQRVRAVKDADRILVLDDGRVAGMGTHEELLAGCEEYQEICSVSAE